MANNKKNKNKQNNKKKHKNNNKINTLNKIIFMKSRPTFYPDPQTS